MERDFQPETPHHPPPLEANIGCDRQLTGSRSDASSLTAENCQAVIRISANVKPVDGTGWTDEKHSLYLHHLEVSFVKQLHHSKALRAQCSEQNLGVLNVSQKRLTDVKNSPDQFKVLQNGCWQKINCVKGEPVSSSSSADLFTPHKSKQVYNFKRIGNNCSLPSAEVAGSLEVWNALKHTKGITSHRFTTFSQECSSGDSYIGDLFDLQREGTGQNFPDEGAKRTTNFESRAKRSNITLAESALQDQIVPSTKSAEYSVIGSSVPENFEI